MRVWTHEDQQSSRHAERGGCQAARLLAAATCVFRHSDPGLQSMAPNEAVNAVKQFRLTNVGYLGGFTIVLQNM
jgi:hypothetical protein